MSGGKKRPEGRPSSFKTEYIEQAKKLCELAATDEDLADFFDVSARTIYRWANEFPEFCQALKAGKEVCDERVVRSLYHRAVGYTFDAVKIMAVAGEVKQVPYKEHVPPDTTAQIFWLKNRRKDQWRDRHEHEIGGPGDFDRMNNDELAEYIKNSIAEIGGGNKDTNPPSTPRGLLGSGRPN